MKLNELIGDGNNKNDNDDEFDVDEAMVEMYIGSDSILFPTLTPMKVEDMEVDPTKRRK